MTPLARQIADLERRLMAKRDYLAKAQLSARARAAHREQERLIEDQLARLQAQAVAEQGGA